MAKLNMVCPFTQRVCVECPIYRGRHFYHCFSKSISGSEWEKTKHSYVEFRKAEQVKDNDKTFGIPAEMVLKSSVLHDVEELIESEELSKLKERRKG
jgi:hypothetical protein